MRRQRRSVGVGGAVVGEDRLDPVIETLWGEFVLKLALSSTSLRSFVCVTLSQCLVAQHMCRRCPRWSVVAEIDVSIATPLDPARRPGDADHLSASKLRPKPGLAPRQASGCALLPAAIQPPGLPLGFATVQGKRGSLGGEKGRLDADRAAVEPWRSGEVEWLEKVAPVQADLLLVCANDLLANARRRSFPRKGCCNRRGAGVAERLVKQILNVG